VEREASNARPAGRDEVTSLAADERMRALGDAIQNEAVVPRRIPVARILMLFVAAVSLYLVAPSVVEVLSSAPRLSAIAPWWFAVVVACQTASFVCVWVLQRIAFRIDGWFIVVTSQLAGNALSRVVPGGGAVGAALQFRMLSTAGADPASAVAGLTAFSLLQTASIFALPLFSLPAILAGTPVNRGLAQSAVLGAVAFVLVAGLGAVLLATDFLLSAAGRSVQRLHNRLLRKRPPITGLPARLLRERDAIRQVLGARRWEASLAVAGRLGFDYLSLLAALTAVGADPNPSLVLLAYASALLLASLPITPGGIGLVEAGLTATLVLAGVQGGDAVLAVLLYRLASYWLPIMVGGIAYMVFRVRYRSSADDSSTTTAE
jgi:uncharacterized protein (TIRG00374 family)